MKGAPPARAAFRPNRWARAGWLLFGAYLVYAGSHIEFRPARVVAGLSYAASFLSRLFPPDFHRAELLLQGMGESLQIAVLASMAGVAIALPLSLAAARNLMPAWLTWPARALTALCRSLHPVVIAILFVKAVGFGPLAGILALTVASVGLLGKLFADAIEDVSFEEVEAVRASGAPLLSVLAFAVLPQVFPRFVGFISYEMDANLRNATMVGIVGAGGIGSTLLAAFQRFDYDFVSAIVLTIIALIMASEVLSMRIKRVFEP